MVAIKGFEMPETCGKCPLQKPTCQPNYYICDLTNKDTPRYTKQEDCPLVEIKPCLCMEEK